MIPGHGTPPAAFTHPAATCEPAGSDAMKCQECDKQAVFHITELEVGDVRELHLCEDHARGYLNQSEPAGGGPSPKKPAAAAGALGVTQTADELALIDQKSCGMCGITFFEFRNQGRLGCPHDYVQFEKELEPLIVNIHGAAQHTGRRPVRRPGAGGGSPATRDGIPEDTAELTSIIGLRGSIKDAISREDYEQAREYRDLIKAIEGAWFTGPPPTPSGPAAGGDA